jgi:hypothetical protein
MESTGIDGYVDEQHRLFAVVPGSIPPGPVTVYIAPRVDEDDTGATWMAGIAAQWADELADTRQDIYTLSDGEHIDPT